MPADHAAAPANSKITDRVKLSGEDGLGEVFPVGAAEGRVDDAP
ncbi:MULTISPECIES: hypothetical protein [unclassified Streptomyces]|nr:MULTISPECIES: hypothetical protein [unclassified Streptomyces]